MLIINIKVPFWYLDDEEEFEGESRVEKISNILIEIVHLKIAHF